MSQLNIENTLKDVLNVGIGLLRVGEENLQAGLKSVVTQFDTLKDKGSADSSASAQKLREVLDNSVQNIKSLSAQAEENFSRISREVQKGYEKTFEGIRSTIGEEQYAKLSNSINEVRSAIQERTEAVQKNANDWLAQLKKPDKPAKTSKKTAAK